MAASVKMGNTRGITLHQRVTWALVGSLFLLRIPFYTGAWIIIPTGWRWIEPVYEIGTYLVTALLIWWERERLADYHMDGVVLSVVILGKPLELLLYTQNIPFMYPARSTAYYLYLPIAIGLGVALHAARPQLPRLSLKTSLWLLTGIACGIALGVYFGGVTKTFSSMPNQASAITWGMVIFLPVQQMLMAGIAEEPFFRGFLWGTLRKAELKDVWIWLIQAGFFWLGHIYALTNNAPWSFWLIVPVGSLVLGWLAWRSRSIATSLVAHGLANGVGQIVGTL